MTPALGILCVGTGRDGTLSLSNMFRELFEREGAGRTVMHEYGSREFAHCFADFMETGEEKYRDQARRLILECPHACIVGNGYAPWLDLFRETCGPELKLVHVRRLDRARCVQSLRENAELFPVAYGSYSDAPDAFWRRMAGFHFGMSREAWFGLSLEEKLGWYFDKTHELADRDAPLFEKSWQLHTEELSEAPTRDLVAAIAGVHGRPAAAHLNSHAFAATMEPELRARIQWLFGQLDLEKAGRDDLYPVEYFLNALIAWTGYQIGRTEQISATDQRTNAELADVLHRATLLLERTQNLVNLLGIELSKRSE